MKKLRSQLLGIVMVGVLMAILIPGSIYLAWFTNTQHEQLENIFKSDSYDNAYWYDNDEWNLYIYVESFAASITEEHPTREELADPVYLSQYMQRVQTLSEQLIFGVDYFTGLFYQVNPELAGDNVGIYRMQKEDKSRETVPLDQVQCHLDEAWAHVDEAEDGIWIGPYYNPDTKINYIAFIKGVYLEDHTLVGLTGVNYNYDYLTKGITDMKPAHHEIYTLLNPDGEVMAPNPLPNFDADTMTEILNATDDGWNDTVKVEGHTYSVYAYRMMNGDIFVSYTDHAKLYEKNYKIIWSVLILSLILVLLLTTILSFYIADVFKGALNDRLTGAWNRNAYNDLILELDGKLRDRKEPFVIFVFDINGLKRENDTKGHQSGDVLIQQAYARIANAFPKDRIYRIGGDEFVVVCQGDEIGQGMENYLKFLKEMDDNTEANRQGQEYVVIAAGQSTFDAQKDHCFDDVFVRADEDMYRQKKKFYQKFPEHRRQ